MYVMIMAVVKSAVNLINGVKGSGARVNTPRQRERERGRRHRVKLRAV